ncbi:MAG: hypothetical protein WBM61_09590 [Woeseiaceae bacterium]
MPRHQRSRALGHQMVRGFLDAGVAIMLTSKAGAFITGEIIRVDGGATLVSWNADV